MLDHSEDRHKAEEQGEEASCSRQAGEEWEAEGRQNCRRLAG